MSAEWILGLSSGFALGAIFAFFMDALSDFLLDREEDDEWLMVEQYGNDNGCALEARRHYAVADWLEVEAECELPADYDEAQDVGRLYAIKVANAYLGDPS